ncbi:hypothetical protein QTN25_004619 [Entamoeba marina]
MFNWFFKAPPPSEKHTTFASSNTWIAEVNNPVDKQIIRYIFSSVFQLEHFVPTEFGSSLLAILPIDLLFAQMTFGTTKESDIVLVTFKDNEDENVVTPIIRLFGERLQQCGLLKDMTPKIPKNIDNPTIIPFTTFAKQQNIDIDNLSMYAILKSTLTVIDVTNLISKKICSFGYQGYQHESRVVFEKEEVSIELGMGTNEDEEVIMHLKCSKENENWAEITETIGELLTMNNFLLIYEKIQQKK